MSQTENAVATHDGMIVLPTSSVQRRLWFLEQFDSDSAIYNTPVAWRLSGALNREALERSLNEIIARHEILRTTFAADGDTVVQRVAPHLRLPLPLVDLSDRPDAESAWRSLAVQDARCPFDLQQGPLLRTRLFRLSPDEHVLALTSHHIILDGWSLTVLFRELDVLYDAFRQQRAARLPELPIQYGDYAAWQQERLSTPDLQRQLEYWRERVSGLGALDLPIARPRPKLQTYKGALRPLSIPAPLAARLRALGVQEKSTAFMTLAAAFLTLLHRYSSQEDLALGFIGSGRNRSELEGLLGCFINTVVLRADLSGDPTFRQLLSRVRESALGAYAHQELPFERLVEELPERDLSRSPLFQVLFNQVPASKDMRIGDLAVRQIPVDMGVAKFEMTVTLSADDRAGGVEGTLEYNSDLFDEPTIDRLIGHYQVLLDAISANPDGRLSTFPLLTPAEVAQQRRWNDTSTVFPDESLHSLISAQAARTPDRVAVESPGLSFTYRELETRANAIARALRAHGVVPGDRVGVFMEREAHIIAAVLGILKAGAAYVPMDPAFPQDRLAYMAEDSGAAVLVTTRGTKATPPSSRIPILRVDELELSGADATAAMEPGPDAIAYVLYTSGSTGRPKGVTVTQRALVNLLESAGRAPGLTERDVLLSITTLSFDIATVEIYLPLLKGARVFLATREEMWDGRRLIARLESTRATVLQATPASWRMLLDAGWAGTPGLKAISGGEPVTRDFAKSMFRRSAEFWNGYGPTETTVYSTFCHITPSDEIMLIGRPVANTQVWVVNQQLQPQPVGVPGELYIGGVGVAPGYWQRPQLTAERFVPDPFSSEAGARLYRTGDLARWMPDGRLECLGRTDHQVKIRGFRIELGEIEATIAEHVAVRAATTIVREDVPGDKRLVAYLVAEQPPADLIEQIRARLRAVLPEYMVPSAFVVLDRLPLTPNNKVDRKALPAPDVTQVRPAAEVVAPRTATEQTVMSVFGSVLGRPELSVLDNFFDLGGHSLKAALLIARLQKATGVEVPLRSLFEAPTIAGLAKIVDAIAWVAQTQSHVVADAGAREEIEL